MNINMNIYTETLAVIIISIVITMWLYSCEQHLMAEPASTTTGDNTIVILVFVTGFAHINHRFNFFSSCSFFFHFAFFLLLYVFAIAWAKYKKNARLTKENNYNTTKKNRTVCVLQFRSIQMKNAVVKCTFIVKCDDKLCIINSMHLNFRFSACNVDELTGWLLWLIFIEFWGVWTDLCEIAWKIGPIARSIITLLAFHPFFPNRIYFLFQVNDWLFLAITE